MISEPASPNDSPESASPAAPAAAPEWQIYPRPDDPGEHTVVGAVRILEGVESPQLGNVRDLLVHLPPSYHEQPERRYPVLYMQDGQNLFDRALAFADEWHVDGTMQELGAEGLEAIVVGINNTPARLDEYSAWKDVKNGGGRAEEYLAFLTDTVRPIIDRDFRTRTEREHTGILGSSMGGLASLYGFIRRPDVFGFAGAMSPSLWFADRAVFDMIEDSVHTPGRIYLDVGTREGPRTLGDARRLRGLLLSRGYQLDHDLCYVEEKDAQHHEPAWGRRLRDALRFLLGSAPAGGA